MPPSFFSKLTRSPTQTRDRRVSSESAVAGRRSPSPARKRIASILQSSAPPPVPTLPVNTNNVSPATSHTILIVPPSPSEHTSDVSGIDGLPTDTSAVDLISQKHATSFDIEDNNSTPVVADFPTKSEKPVPATLATPELKKQASDRSMRSVNLPPITVNTADDENGEVTMTPIVESPTAMERKSPIDNASLFSTTNSANGHTTSTANTSPAPSSLWPPPPSRDSDSASTIAKKHKWRRGSTNNQRKPSGLASAIAASGLAMANSGITGVVSPPIPMLSPASTTKSSASRKGTMTGSPPYLGSPPQSTASHSRGASQDFSPKRTGRRRRRQSTTLSTSGHSIDHSDVVYGQDNGNYSGLEESSSGGDSSDDDDDLDGFDLDHPDTIPVTGFAVASNKRNADFHEMFPSIPDGDYLIEDYGCALQRDILIQGRLYISENHICFHANIFGWVTDLMIPIYDILTLEKKMTAFVIPNALLITTRQSKYSFASFLARDTTYDVIYNIWHLARPEDGFAGSFNGGDSGRGSLEDARANGQPKKVALQNKVTQCACGREGKHYTETALDSVFPGTPDRIYGLIFASGFMKDFMRVDQKLMDVQISDWQPREPGSKLLARNMSYIKPLTGTFGPKQAKCEIRDETEHLDFEDYVSTVTTTRTPEVPSGGVFSVKTRTCITWASAVTTRVVVTTQVDWTGRSFVKGIIVSSSIEGQLQYHGDLDKAMRAYIHEHRSEFVPAGVDPAVMEAAEASPSVEDNTTKALQDSGSTQGMPKKKNDQRGIQWAWDTFSGAYKVGKQSATGAIELLKDVWDNSTSTGILYLIIAVLVASNLWTIISSNRSKDADTVRRRERQRDRSVFGGGRIALEDKEKWVQTIVTALWEELALNAAPIETPVVLPTVVPTLIVASTAEPALPTPLDPKEEIRGINDALNAIQERVAAIKESLRELNEVD